MERRDARMDLKNLIVDLRERGVRFWIEEGRIHISAPTGVLTEEIGRRIGVHRDELWALMLDVACASYEDKVGTQIFEDLAHGAIEMQDRGAWDSPEHAEERQRIEAEMDRNDRLLDGCRERYAEYERLFGEGCAYNAHWWLPELRVEPQPGQIDREGTIGEVIMV
jgi:hypothetical protein